MQNFSLLVGRLGLASLWIVHGIFKLTAYTAAARLFATHGVAPGLLPIAILIELGGGFAIACGIYTRTAASVLFGYTLLVALAFHGVSATQAAVPTSFLQQFAIAGGFLVLAASGAGRWSVDAWRHHHRRRPKNIFS